MPHTNHAMCNLLRAFIVFAGLFAGSCSDGGSDSSGVTQDEFLMGGFSLPGEYLGPLAGIQVRAVDTQGTIVATATTGPAGNFALGRESWTGFVGHIEADAEWPGPDAAPVQLRLRRDIDRADESSGYLWLGPISTLASRYRAIHPELAIEASHAAALKHLGIPNVGKEPGFEPHTAFGESHRSPASWSRLLAAVGSSTLEEFIDTLVLEMGAGAPPRSFRIPHPYPKLRGLLYGNGATGTGAGAYQLFNEPFFSWGAECTRVVSDYRIMAGDQLFGFAIESLGIGGGVSTEELAEAIAEIQNELSALNLTLTQNQLSEAWGYTAGTIADPAVETIRMINNQYLQYMAVDPQNADAAASLLQSRQPDLMYAVANLRDMLLGGPPAPFGPIGLIYARSKSLERFGVNPSEDDDKAWNSMQFRDNEFLDDARVATDYYCGWLVLGMNLLIEWSHLNSSTFPVPVAGNANLLPAKASLLQGLIFGDATQPGINYTIRKAQQMVPPAIIGSENVIVDCGWNNVGIVNPDDISSINSERNTLANIGTMFHKQVQYQIVATQCWNGPKFLSDGAFPYNSFRPATLAEYKRLRDRAKAVNPNSPKQGLVALGFHVVLGSGDLQFGYYHDSAGYLGGDGWHVYNFDQDKDDGGVQQDYDSVNLIAVRNTPGDRGNPGYAGYLEDAGTALVTGWFTSLAVNTQSDMTASVVRSRREAWMPDSIYPGSLAASDQVVTNISPNDTADASFSVGDYISWQTSDTTTVLPTNLAGSNAQGLDDLRSRIIWRRESLPASGYTITGNLLQGLSASAGTLGCMTKSLQSTPIALDAIFDPAVSSSLMVTPNGLVYDLLDLSLSPTVNCYATGYFVSQSTATAAEPAGVGMRDMTLSSATNGTVQWSASSPSGLAYFNPGSNVLHLDAAQGIETVTITVTITPPGGAPMQASGAIQVVFD